MTQAIFPRVQVWGDVAAVARSDAAYARRFFATHADRGSVIGSPGTDFLTAGGRLYDSWPASPDENQYTRVQDSNVETLLIGGRLDVATPPQNGKRELLPHLSKGHEVVLPDIGHTDDFWTYQTPASNRLINTYLDSGRVDTSLYTRTPVDFTPALGHGPIAEIVLGAMLALAASDGALAGVDGASRAVARPVRTQEQRRAPRRVSARARAGRLFLGLLIVLATNIGVALTDELVVVVLRGRADRARRLPRLGEPRLGHPGEHGAWRRQSAGALIGAWLGFNVTAAGFGFLAPFVAIVGATAGANLFLIALDIAWDRQARVRLADDRPTDGPRGASLDRLSTIEEAGCQALRAFAPRGLASVGPSRPRFGQPSPRSAGRGSWQGSLAQAERLEPLAHVDRLLEIPE